MRFKQIIFDVDDTLIDFAATENYALHRLFAAHHWPLTANTAKEYHAYNEGMWRKLEQGAISYQELSDNLFSKFLGERLDLNVDGRSVMAEYRSYFGQTHHLLPGVRDSLKFARRQGYQLAIISNGEQYMQTHRLALAGIENDFALIVTSQEAGYAKPNGAIFDYFFAQSSFSKDETIFFGDGLRSDILGAENYGMASVWFNHRHRKNTLALHPLATVSTYQDLVKLIQNDFKNKDF